MLVLAIASVLHYFDIFTFHTVHYWAALFLEIAITHFCAKIKRYC